MGELKGKWIKLEQKGSSPGARSSHAITVCGGNKVYAFGGEFTPRVPVDNNLYIFDLSTQTWSIADSSGEIPPPRVGVTMASINDTIYVFGGRDTDHKELNELYRYNTVTGEWTLVSSGETGPPHRSYHSVAADERRVYVFGGCGVEGRLNDLWAYDVVEKVWTELGSGGDECKGRGGPGLVVVSGKVWVVYGFAGKEMDDVHWFDLGKKEWKKVETSGGEEKPSARSVFAGGVIGDKYVYVFGGEIDPSDLGHLGAGKFSGDLFVLDTEELRWRKVEDRDLDQNENHPGPRGWCAFAAADKDGKQGLIVYGGNSDSNDRLDDMFFFTPS